MKIHELSLIYSILLKSLFGISWPQQYESLFALGSYSKHDEYLILLLSSADFIQKLLFQNTISVSNEGPTFSPSNCLQVLSADDKRHCEQEKSHKCIIFKEKIISTANCHVTQRK